MYKIPDDLEIGNLEKEIISQICYGLNFIMLCFNRGSIQISGSFSIRINEETFYYREIYPVNKDFGLLNLLEKQITNVQIEDDRTTICLKFEGGIILRLKSSNMYESFELNFDGKRVIV